jgi:Histidine kinase
MPLRALLLLLILLLAPAASAQPVPFLGIRDPEACASRGAGEDLADIDTASCRPVRHVGLVDSQHRIVWVRGRVTVPEGYAPGEPVGFHIGGMAAREIWWNGQRIGADGHPGASREAETPGNIDSITWIPPDLIHAGDNLVAIRFSTFHLAIPMTTPLHYAAVGRFGDVKFMSMTMYAPGLATTGALIAAALFFGFTWLTDRRSLGPLFISVMSLCVVGQFGLESLRAFTPYPYPLQAWRLVGIAILAFAFALSMTAYVARRFAPERWRLHVAGAAVIGLTLFPLMPGFDGRTLGFILGPSVIAFAAAAQGIAARRPGAKLTTLTLGVFVALQLIETAMFLERTFYLSVSFLALVLFIDQVRALRRARIAEEQARRRAATLELELLRRRIAPHFLMNTLNALAEWVESDPKTGVKMIEALAEEFRLLSQISDRPLIPLSEEIALCRRHLEVMSYRVDRAFSLATRNIDETAEVPPGVLHTLVENAFTHGRFDTGGEFVLTSESDDVGERLVLLAPPATAPRESARPAPGGEGLAYVRRRLEAAFGAGAGVESAAAGNGWRTVLTIPRPLRGLAT